MNHDQRRFLPRPNVTQGIKTNCNEVGFLLPTKSSYYMLEAEDLLMSCSRLNQREHHLQAVSCRTDKD